MLDRGLTPRRADAGGRTKGDTVKDKIVCDSCGKKPRLWKFDLPGGRFVYVCYDCIAGMVLARFR